MGNKAPEIKAVRVSEATRIITEAPRKKSRTSMLAEAIIGPAEVKEIYEPPMGVSIALLRKLCRENSQRVQGFEEFTTGEVCNRIIKPLTAANRNTFVDLYRGIFDERNRAYIAPATVFVSHVYSYSFSDFMSALENANVEAYFWIDFLSLPQHGPPEVTPVWLSLTLFEIVKTIGAVLLILAPWNDPVPATRSWCIIELMAGLSQHDVVVQAHMPRQDTKAMIERVMKEPMSIFQALADVRSEKSQAQRLDERHTILSVLKEEFGFDQVNRVVKDFFVEWYIQKLKEYGAVVLKGSTLEDARAAVRLGDVFEQVEMFDEAVGFFQTALRIRKSKLANGHLDVAAMHSAIGRVLLGKEDFTGSQQHHELALAMRRKLLPPKHRDVTDSLYDVGMALLHDGKADVAIPLLNESLLAVGEDKPEAAKVFRGLGDAYDQQLHFDHAIACYKQILTLKLAEGGPKYAETVQAYNLIGLEYSKMGSDDEAVEWLQKGIDCGLGNHAETANSFSLLGDLYMHGKRNLAKAIEFHSKALAIRQSVFGNRHNETASSFNSIGLALFSKGDKKKAREYFQSALDILVATEGKDSVLAATVQQSLTAASAYSS